MIPPESVAPVACLVLLLAGCHPSSGTTGPGELVTVTYVADGDTVGTVDGAGERVRVRLLGIDAPEVAHDGKAGECGAADAAAALERLVLHQRVTLVDDPRADPIDRYGRRLAYVDVAGVDVALHQLKAGYAAAWHPRSEPQPLRHGKYVDAERAARKARAGAWASCTSLGR